MFDANARADLLCIALVIISFRRNPYVFKLSLHNLTDEAKLKLRLNFQIMNAAMLKKIFDGRTVRKQTKTNDKKTLATR